jgi:hypothetical protein
MLISTPEVLPLETALGFQFAQLCNSGFANEPKYGPFPTLPLILEFQIHFAYGDLLAVPDH